MELVRGAVKRLAAPHPSWAQDLDDCLPFACVGWV